MMANEAIDKIINHLPMDDMRLERCSEAYMSELAKWDTRINRESETPFEVVRFGPEGEVDRCEGHKFQRDSDEQYEKLSHRAAAAAFLVAYASDIPE